MSLIILHYKFRLCNLDFYSAVNQKTPSMEFLLLLDVHAHLTIEAQVMGKGKLSCPLLCLHGSNFHLDIVSVCRYNDNGDDYEYQ